MRDGREFEVTEAKKKAQIEKQSIHTGYEKGEKDFGGRSLCQQWAAGDQALTDAHHTTGRQSRPHAAPVS